MCSAPQFRHLNFQKWSVRGVFYAFWLRNVLRAITTCAFWTPQLLKVFGKLRNVLRATTACTFWRSKLPKMRRSWFEVLLAFWLGHGFEIYFAPQPRALFKELNFHKCSDNGVFSAIWMRRAIVDLSSYSTPPFRPSRATKHRKSLGGFSTMIFISPIVRHTCLLTLNCHAETTHLPHWLTHRRGTTATLKRPTATHLPPSLTDRPGTLPHWNDQLPHTCLPHTCPTFATHLPLLSSWTNCNI